MARIFQLSLDLKTRFNMIAIFLQRRRFKENQHSQQLSDESRTLQLWKRAHREVALEQLQGSGTSRSISFSKRTGDNGDIAKAEEKLANSMTQPVNVGSGNALSLSPGDLGKENLLI
jgi:hypothetical protein